MMGSVARRYAKAIFSLAAEEKALEQIGKQLDRLAEVASQPDIAAVFGNPVLGSAARTRLADTLSAELSLDPTTSNFVHLLADHRRLDILRGIADHYQKLLDEYLGRVRAVVRTAVPLEPAQRKEVQQTLESLTKKAVLAGFEVEPDLLGGIQVEVQGRVYDGTVRTQLHRLAARIAAGRSFL